MVRLAITVPVIFLVLFSLYPVFADTGSINVISGKTFQINYDASGVKVVDAQPDSSLSELLISIQVSGPAATLDLTLPRELIDSRNKTNDIPFIVVVDGTLVNSVETNPTTTSRTVSLQLTPDMKQIEIIGTTLASSQTIVGTTPSSAPPTPPPEQTSPTTSSPSVPLSAKNETKQTMPQPPTAKETNMTQEKLPIPVNVIQDFISKIPYLSTISIKLNTIDYAVIGSIALVVIIVIASAARSKARQVARRKPN